MSVLIVDEKYIETHLEQTQWLENYLKQVMDKEDKLLVHSDDLDDDFTVIKILRYGLRYDRSEYAQLTITSVREYFRRIGGIREFLKKPIYLKCAVAAMAMYNNRIQDLEHAKYWHMHFYRAMRLYKNLFNGARSDREGALAFRAICALKEYHIAEELVMNTPEDSHAEDDEIVMEFLRSCVDCKIVLLAAERRKEWLETSSFSKPNRQPVRHTATQLRYKLLKLRAQRAVLARKFRILKLKFAELARREEAFKQREEAVSIREQQLLIALATTCTWISPKQIRDSSRGI